MLYDVWPTECTAGGFRQVSAQTGRSCHKEEVIHVTTASATLLLSGSGIFQVWHMQKRKQGRRAQLLEKHGYTITNASYLSHLDMSFIMQYIL